MNRRDWLVALVLALAAFVVYGLTLAPDLLPGDSGEFQLAVPLLGIVHPTGYPLYLLLGKLFTLLPLGTIASRVNLFSAVSAAAAVGAFYGSARILSALLPSPSPLPGSVESSARPAPALHRPLPEPVEGDPVARPLPEPEAFSTGSEIPPALHPMSASPQGDARPEALQARLQSPAPGLTTRPQMQTLPPAPVESLALSIVAAAIALALAFSPTWWSQATEAEVYALNALFIIVLLGLSIWLRESPSFRAGQNPRDWLWLALALGLSFAHHRTTILLAPVLAVYLFPYCGLRAVLPRALLLFLLPLLLYLYTPLRYDASPYLQTKLDAQHVIVSLDDTPQAFVGHFLGVGFRGALRWDDRAPERLAATLPRVASEFTPLGLLLALLGIVALLQARRSRMLLMFLAAAGAYTLFNALYQIGDIADFYTPLYILVAFLMLSGALAVVQFALKRSLHSAAALVLFALPALLLFGNFTAVQSTHDTTVRTHWQSLLSQALPSSLLPQAAVPPRPDGAAPPRPDGVPAAFTRSEALVAEQAASLLPAGTRPQVVPAVVTRSDALVGEQAASLLPAGAILISNDRDEMTPLLYLQFVEGVRRDIAGLFPLISTDPQYAHVVPLTEAALRTARPVYFIKPMDGLSIKFRLQPEGPLVHVLGAQDTRPDVVLSRDSSIARLVGWSHSVNTNRSDPLVISLYWQPLGESRADFKTYVHFDGPDGKTIAQSDHTPGGDFYPPSQWRPGDTLRDAHNLVLPAGLPPATYQLVAGAYFPDGRSVDGIARVDLGSFDLSP